MTYQENYQKWVDFADLPDYLRQDLENMDEKQKKMLSTPILNLVLQVCAA
ncbi:conserved domain protein [Streptococcus oralis SK313]|uniref:Conserved domain protein n=1 Tax=Streptococcus oralis SK313 TaxID=1035190 RepID=F9Q141_STROR|nr:conserved domain protein [Streptococcus oralis SK313]